MSWLIRRFGRMRAARCIAFTGIALLTVFWINIIDNCISLYLRLDLSIVALSWICFVLLMMMTIVGRSVRSILTMRKNHSGQLLCNIAIVVGMVISVRFKDDLNYAGDTAFLYIHLSYFDSVASNHVISGPAVRVFEGSQGNAFKYFIFVDNAPLPDGLLTPEMMDRLGLDTFRGCEARAERLIDKYYAVHIGC